MAKPKSVKLRTLIALQALFKCTDEKHGLTGVLVNEILKPYKLDCDQWFFSSLIEDLRTFGIDVQRDRGYKIKNHPFTEEKFQKLLFAVSTNPYLSKEEATEILQNLKPFVTIYQEEYLEGVIDTTETDKTFYKLYYVFQKGIRDRTCVRYITKSLLARNKEARYFRFSPTAIYHADGCLYVKGYNHARKKEEAVEFSKIADATPIRSHPVTATEKAQHILETFKPGFAL